MSRLECYEGDGEFNPWNGWRGRAISGKRTNAMLKEFLAHLDAMPVKRIALDHLYDHKTGDMCTVGEFARMRGVPMDEIQKRAKESAHIVELEDVEDGTHGPTVTIGKKAGLPMTIAWELAYNNDRYIGVYQDVQGPPTYSEYIDYIGFAVGWRLKPLEFQLRILVPMSAEERWERVREKIVRLIKEHEQVTEYKRKSRESRAAAPLMEATA